MPLWPSKRSMPPKHLRLQAQGGKFVLMTHLLMQCPPKPPHSEPAKHLRLQAHGGRFECLRHRLTQRNWTFWTAPLDGATSVAVVPNAGVAFAALKDKPSVTSPTASENVAVRLMRPSSICPASCSGNDAVVRH